MNGWWIEELILASGSPRRAELLREAGIPFKVQVSHVDEVQDGFSSVRELCERNAFLKASSVAQSCPGRWVLGADTLVTWGGHVYGKPEDLSDARRMFEELSGKRHEVITAVALIREGVGSSPAVERVFSVVTGVTFKKLFPVLIDTYFSLVNPLDKAGAYGIQEQGDLIIEGIEGSLSNVIGLPLEELKRQLIALKGEGAK